MYLLRCAFFNIVYAIKPVDKELKNNQSKKKIIIINTPEHDNLGDHAIALAEEILLRDYLPDYYVYEVTHHHYKSRKTKLLKYISDEDIIAITCGGYLGSMWFHNDILIRDVIKTFIKNRIVFFPQTFFYENFNEEDIEYNITMNCFKAHHNIIMILREQKSYDFATNYFKDCFNKCFQAPDIVLYLNETDNTQKRNGYLVCLRNDREKIIDDSLLDAITKHADKKGVKINFTDTLAGKVVFKKSRKKELTKKLDEFRQAEVVITDRLHGMIFAAITSTPCIALNNKTSKVEGVYKWIAYLDYIKYIKTTDEVYTQLDELKELKNCRYSNEQLIPYFVKITDQFTGDL